jgi:hypothetical protein
MATRYAGDFFGVSLEPDDSANRDKSTLLDYFPDLRKTQKRKEGEMDSGARNFRNRQAVSPFTGFKTLEASNENQKAAPEFFGYKQF